MIVLDTNVTSELMRASPSAAILEWLGARLSDDLCSTAVTVAEIRYGIARMPDGRRKRLLAEIEADVFGAFAERVLPFDREAAHHYAEIVSARASSGRPMAIADGQIAAICRLHGATLATRNVKDFEGAGIDLVDPWVPV